MVIFNSYVSLPQGTLHGIQDLPCFLCQDEPSPFHVLCRSGLKGMWELRAGARAKSHVMIPWGYLLHSHGIGWPIEIDGLPIQNGDFPVRYVSHNQMVNMFCSWVQLGISKD